MFTFYIQLLDLLHLHQVGLFLIFFVVSWGFLISRWIYSIGYIKDQKKRNAAININGNKNLIYLTAIIPVVDEPMEIWKHTLDNLKSEIEVFENYDVVIVANGGNGKDNADYAEKLGFNVVRLKEAGKRPAIKAGVEFLKQNISEENKGLERITLILDSDTIVGKQSIIKLVAAFRTRARVGGVTPKHEIFRRDANFYRLVSDWLEDTRFNEVLPGQSKNGAVSCLPGRMLAIKTDLLEQAVDSLVSQTFMGNPCISGDDRYLTSWLLERNWRCIYEPSSIVYTDAPNTLNRFLKQRLRWSRTSLRETIRSLKWTFKYPYTAYTVIGNILLRWLYASVIVTFALFLLGLTVRDHYLHFSIPVLLIGTLLGFIVSGFLRQLGHLRRYPQDIKYLIPFLFVTTFALMPTEWYGNLTMKESGWMTRDVH